MQRSVLRQVWRRLIHTDPSAIEGGQDSWTSIWEPSEALLLALGKLPDGLLSYWLYVDRGHIVIDAGPSAYHPGPQSWQGRTFEGLCHLGSGDLATDEASIWQALFALFDHLLGSACLGNERLSDGKGASPHLQGAARRLRTACDLGYASELLGVSTPPGYLAHGWLLYLTHRKALNVADPILCRLLDDSLMNDAFWQLVLAEQNQTGSAVRS